MRLFSYQLLVISYQLPIHPSRLHTSSFILHTSYLLWNKTIAHYLLTVLMIDWRLSRFYTTCITNTSHCAKVRRANYIPELAKVNPDLFSICVITVDGQVYQVGDYNHIFTIQSISKVFVYGMALEDHGRDYVLTKVGVEPIETLSTPLFWTKNPSALIILWLMQGRSPPQA